MSYKGMTGWLFDDKPLEIDPKAEREQRVTTGASLLERLGKYDEPTTLPDLLFEDIRTHFSTDAAGVHNLVSGVRFAKQSIQSLCANNKLTRGKESKREYSNLLRQLARKSLD